MLARLVVTAMSVVLWTGMTAALEPAPLRVCMLSGSEEYESDKTLESLRVELETKHGAKVVLLKARGVDKLPGLEALETCDVAVFFTRRLTISGEPLEQVKRYVGHGRPIVGIRTASHGFQNWLEFDPLVLGGNYKGHFGRDKVMTTSIAATAKDHPILRGVGAIESTSTLYKAAPLREDCELLLNGTTADSTQPVAWTTKHNGGRVFYTSLGGQEDFENPRFRRMLINAIFWASGREAPKPTPTSSPNPKQD